MTVTLKARFGRALAWSAGGEWGRQGLSFVIFGIIARVIPPAAFGLVALASAFIVLGQVLVDQGLSDAIVQRRELEQAHLDTAFWLTLAIGIALSVLGLIAARPIAVAFRQLALVPILSWMLLALPLAALSSIQQAVLRRAMNFRALAIRSLVATATGGTVGIVLALKGYGVWALVAQTLTTNATGVAALWTASEWRPGLTFSRGHLSGLLSFGWNIGGAGVLGFVSRRSDDMIVGFFLGPVALGYYTMAYRVFELTQGALVSVTGTVSYPVFAKLQATPSRVTSVFLDLTQFMSLVAFPMVLGVSLLAPDLIATAFGARWAPSARVLRVLIFAGVTNSLFAFNALVLKSMGKPAWVFRLAAVDALLNVVAFLICVRWGIVAVGGAFVARAYVMVPLRLWLLPRVIPLSIGDYFRGLAPAAISTMAMAAVVVLGRTMLGAAFSAPVRLGLLSCLGALTYVGATIVFAPSIYRRTLEAARVVLTPAA